MRGYLGDAKTLIVAAVEKCGSGYEATCWERVEVVFKWFSGRDAGRGMSYFRTRTMNDLLCYNWPTYVRDCARVILYWPE